MYLRTTGSPFGQNDHVAVMGGAEGDVGAIADSHAGEQN